MPIPSSGDTPSVAVADSASSSSIKGEGLIFPTTAEEYSFDFARAFVVGCFSKEEEEEEKEEIESMSLSPPSSSRCLLGVDPPLPSISSTIPTADEIDGDGDANSITSRKKTRKNAAPPPRLLPLRAPLVVVVVIVRVLVLFFFIYLFVCLS